jgi:hypothetical protein
VTPPEAKLVATKAAGVEAGAAIRTVGLHVVIEETETITAAAEGDAPGRALQPATTDRAEEMIAETETEIVMTVATAAVEMMIGMAVVTADEVLLESPARPS